MEIVYKTETDSHHRKQTYVYQSGNGGEKIRGLGLIDIQRVGVRAHSVVSNFCDPMDCSWLGSSIH